MKPGFSRLALVVAALAVSGCQQTFPDRAAGLLRNADTLLVFSLEPVAGPSDPKGFHGWPVLGQVAVDKEDREAFVEAVIDGAASNDSERALCFDPRHGIRAVSKTGTVDLVICFECSQVEVFYSGGSNEYFIPNNSLHETLSKRLSKAGIPVAPTMSKRLKQVRR